MGSIEDEGSGIVVINLVFLFLMGVFDFVW